MARRGLNIGWRSKHPRNDDAGCDGQIAKPRDIDRATLFDFPGYLSAWGLADRPAKGHYVPIYHGRPLRSTSPPKMAISPSILTRHSQRSTQYDDIAVNGGALFDDGLATDYGEVAHHGLSKLQRVLGT